jgi:hypothetical protein
MSKQVTKSHVRDAVHMYSVNWGAGLTENYQLMNIWALCLLFKLQPPHHMVCVFSQSYKKDRMCCLCSPNAWTCALRLCSSKSWCLNRFALRICFNTITNVAPLPYSMLGDWMCCPYSSYPQSTQVMCSASLLCKTPSVRLSHSVFLSS